MHRSGRSSPPSRPVGRDNLFVDTDAVRRLEPPDPARAVVRAGDLDGWEARLVDLVRDRGVSPDAEGQRRYEFRKDVSRTQVLAARATRCSPSCSSFKRDADADLCRLPAAGARRRDARYQDAEVSAAGALDFSDLLARGARPDRVERSRFASTCSASSRGSSWTNSRTPIRSGRDPAAPRRRQSRQTVHRRRSKQAIYPLPQDGRRRPTGMRARRALRAVARRRAADDQLSQRARRFSDFVNAAFERRAWRTASRCQASRDDIDRDASSRPSSALPVPRPYAAQAAS